MRKIKFRGKRVDTGEWIQGGYYFDDCYGNPNGEKHYIVVWSSSGLGYYEEIPVDPETVGQFTGLDDKNGVEIFEGDILKAVGDGIVASRYVEQLFVTEWNQASASFVFLPPGKEVSREFDVVYDMATNMIFGICEVIGNIHDHPELLDN